MQWTELNVHDTKNKYWSFKNKLLGIWWGLNVMMFQHVEKMSFSGFQEYFILLLLLFFICKGNSMIWHKYHQ